MNTTTWIPAPIRQIGRVVAVGLLTLSPALLASCQKHEEVGPIGQRAEFDARLVDLDDKEVIRSMLMDLGMAIDTGNAAALQGLAPMLDPSFRLDMTDFLGTSHQFVGVQGLVRELGPLLESAKPDVLGGPISVRLDGNNATAYFKCLSSIRMPQELGLDPNLKLLVMASNTASFVREGGVWKLKSIQAVHSLAYPGMLSP